MRTSLSRTGKVALAPSPTSATSGYQLKSGWMLWGAPTRCGAGVAKSTKFSQGEALEVTTKKNLATTTLFAWRCRCQPRSRNWARKMGFCSSSKNLRKPSPQSPKGEVRIAPGVLALLEGPIADVCKDSMESQTEEKNSQELSEEFSPSFLGVGRSRCLIRWD